VIEEHFRVRYHEADQMGAVHHAAYITWFEEGRSAFTRAIGYPYAAMEADGMALAITDVAARYHQPARYDEEVIVFTCLAELRSRGMMFTYEVRRAVDNTLLVSGTTKLVSVDRQGTVKRLPDAWREKVAAASLIDGGSVAGEVGL